MTIVGTGKALPAHLRDTWRRFDLQALGRCQRKLGCCPVIAHQAHVTAGAQRRLDSTGRVTDHMGTGHGQVVTEDHPIETQLAAQDVLQPAPGETGRLVVDLWIDHMGRHHRRQLPTQTSERHQIGRADLLQAALIGGNRHMGIGLGPAMAGEMLATGGHARGVHTADKGTGQ
ncbi:hypothetical protein D3C78_915790 [compost metagenome]